MMARANPTFALRPYLPQDAPMLAEIMRASVEELTEDDYTPAQQEAWASSADRTPPPIVNGMNTSSAQRRASSATVSRRSWDAVMSRKTISSAPSSW